MSGAPEHPELKDTAVPTGSTAASRRWAHRIVAPRSPIQSYDAVGRCIYCDRGPPEVQLSDEHIIADGLGGDLLLPDASCLDCARITCRYEQQAMRDLLMLPRGALGIRSRKKRPKQTHVRLRVGLGDDLVEKDVPLTAEMPKAFVLFTTDGGPGILTGASPEEECITRFCPVVPADTFERTKAMFGNNGARGRVTLDAGTFGQVVAKTAHAFAIATLGLGRFKPFLTNYIQAHEPDFDGYRLASRKNSEVSDALHEIDLIRTAAPIPSVIGTSWREVYVVRLRLFANLGAPHFLIVVGEPV